MSEKCIEGGSHETWIVSAWLTDDEEHHEYWKEEARRHLAEAPQSKRVKEREYSVEMAARCNLADQLRDAFRETDLLNEPDVYTALLNTAMAKIDWQELAADLLGLEDRTPGVAVAEPSGPCPEESRGPLFDLGRVVSTPAALAALTPADVCAALARHACGDWGIVGFDDWGENQLALKNGCLLLSTYEGTGGTQFCIITGADRSATTVLLPQER